MHKSKEPSLNGFFLLVSGLEGLLKKAPRAHTTTKSLAQSLHSDSSFLKFSSYPQKGLKIIQVCDIDCLFMWLSFHTISFIFYGSLFPQGSNGLGTADSDEAVCFGNIS